MHYSNNDDTSDYLRAIELIEQNLKGIEGSYKKIDYLAELNVELNHLNNYSMSEVANISIKYDCLIFLSKCSMTVKLRVEKWIRETLIAIENGSYQANKNLSLIICNKIHWKDDKPHRIFKQILENLKFANMISYQDIDKVLSGNEKAKFIGKKIFQHAAYLFLKLDEKGFISIPKMEKYQTIANNFDFDTDIDLDVAERLRKETSKIKNPDNKTMEVYLKFLNSIIFENTSD
jgi:hypothetical protein